MHKNQLPDLSSWKHRAAFERAFAPLAFHLQALNKIAANFIRYGALKFQRDLSLLGSNLASVGVL